jgi:hypothetical protein
MKFTDALRGLIIAPIGSVIVALMFTVFAQHIQPSVGFLIVLAMVWVFSLAAGILFVLPFFVFLPQSRNPPSWVAALWGAATAVAAALLLFRTQFSTFGKAGFIIQGALSGLIYVAVVRRTLLRKAG